MDRCYRQINEGLSISRMVGPDSVNRHDALRRAKKFNLRKSVKLSAVASKEMHLLKKLLAHQTRCATAKKMKNTKDAFHVSTNRSEKVTTNSLPHEKCFFASN